MYHGNKKNLLALNESKKRLGLTDLDLVPGWKEEIEYYGYLSKDSLFTDQIVRLFGISCRCWHGCGYLGKPGQPICRFFLLRNKITPNIKISVLKGKDIFV